MRPKRIVWAAALAGGLALLPGRGWAQGMPGSGTGWSAGLGVVASPRPYVGTSTRITPIPLVNYRSRRFSFQGLMLGYRLAGDRRLSVDLVARPSLSGYDPEDSSFLAGMRPRRWSVDAGVALSWQGRRLGGRASLVHDVLGRSGGTVASAGLDLLFRAGAWRLRPGAGLSWESASLVDYYYGVRSSEARSWRPAYRGTSTVDVYGSLLAVRPLWGRWSFFALARVRVLGSGATDSPIVERRTDLTGVVAVNAKL